MEVLPVLPDVYRTDGLDELMESIDWHLQKAKENHEFSIKQRFLDSADDEGISRFERIENIKPFAGQDKESRRSACIVKWNSFVPYTEQVLDEYLETWCGSGNYTKEISEDKENNCLLLTINTSLRFNSQANFVIEQLNAILPLNFTIRVNNTYSGESDSVVETGTSILQTIEQEV